MVLPMQFPRVTRERFDVFEPKSDTKSDTFTRKRRRRTHGEYAQGTRQPRGVDALLGEPTFGPAAPASFDEGGRSRTHPRQIRRSVFPSEKLGVGFGTRTYGRLSERQSRPTVLGETTNQIRQESGGNGNGNGNGKANPPSPATEEEEESESESDSDDDSGDEEEENDEERGNESKGGELPEQNKGETNPSETESIGLGNSQTAAATVTTTGTPGIAPTGAHCAPSTSSSSGQCEAPAPDQLQPHQKAAIATAATVSGIIALLVFAFFFMRSRHGSDYTKWPYIRRYKLKKYRSNSKTESGITILPPPPFQKEDPWIITKGRQSWSGSRRPPVTSEVKNNPRGLSKLQNKPLVRRLLGAPLESNPVTRTPSISSPLHPESAVGPGPDIEPSQVSDLISHRNSNRLTISTRSSQALPEDEKPEISDTRSVRSNPRAQNPKRLPGISYFSWTSSHTSTGLTYHSFMSRSGTSDKRETSTTIDSEPPRFRSISSWVNQQYKRVHGTSDVLPPPPVPKKDSFSPNSLSSARVADSPLKQSMEQDTDPPAKPPPALNKPTPPHPPIHASPLRSSIPITSSAEAPSKTYIPPVPPLPSPHSLPPPPPTPLKPRTDSNYHQRGVSVSTNGTTTTLARMHRKNVSSTASSLPPVFKHHPGEKVEINGF